MKRFRPHSVEPTAWVQTTLNDLVHRYGADPAVDELRVKEAMHFGWRYREPEGVTPSRFLGGLQTSAWFTVESDAVEGVMLGADPYFDELPPLPFKRVAFDAVRGAKPGPLLGFELSVEGDGLVTPRVIENERMVSSGELVFAVPALVVFEIEQGTLWDVMLDLRAMTPAARSMMDGDTTLWGFHVTPGGHTADYDALRDYQGWHDAAVAFDQSFGTLVWKATVSAAHMITASNVRVRQLAPGRKQQREWARRRFAPVHPQIYRVDIQSRTVVIGGGSDREYHCRWMVRGHYRHTQHGEHRHPATGLPATWIGAYVKGPAGAPWKGRPNYTMLNPEPDASATA